jgi:hypothetical protein
MTMASRWSHNPRSSSRASNNHSSSSDSPFVASQGKRSRQASSEHSVPPPAFQDPLPLDDNCAKYVLSVMVLFMRQTAPPEYPLMMATCFTDLTFRDFESPQTTTAAAAADVEEARPSQLRSREFALRTQASSNSVKSGKLSVNSTIQIPTMKAAYEKTHMSLVKSSLPVNTLIAKYAGRIVFHISASNWNAVYTRLRTKIHFLASTTAESPDITDLQLMAHSALDRQRLVQLLNGMLLRGICVDNVILIVTFQSCRHCLSVWGVSLKSRLQSLFELLFGIGSLTSLLSSTRQSVTGGKPRAHRNAFLIYYTQ